MKYEKELNEAGEKWFDAKQKGDSAVAMAQVGILFELIYDIYKGPDDIDAINEFYIKDFSKFNPNTKCFAAFLTDRFKYRQTDIKNMNMMRTKKRAGQDDENTHIMSYDSLLSRDNNETTLGDMLESKELTPENRYLEKEYLGDMITLISGIWFNLQGKADNDRKRLYYRLFTTDTLTCLIKREGNGMEVLHNRERDILNGIYYNFLDYFMEDRCRSLDEISEGKLKLYITDRINNKEIEVRDLPIKNPVYVSYLANIENISVRDSAISEQHKGYKDLLSKLIQK